MSIDLSVAFSMAVVMDVSSSLRGAVSREGRRTMPALPIFPEEDTCGNPRAGGGSGAHLPAIEILALLLGQRVERDAHGLELERGDPLVDLLGHVVDALLELAALQDRPLGRQRLGGEAHVHDAGRVAMRGG